MRVNLSPQKTSLKALALQNSFAAGTTCPRFIPNVASGGICVRTGTPVHETKSGLSPLSEGAGELSHFLADLCDTVIFPNVDGVISFSYPYFSQNREESLKVLASLIHHQNAGGILIPVFREDEADITVLKKLITGMDNRRILFLNCRTSENVIEEGMKLIHELAAIAGRFPREPVPASELTVGMLCASPDVFASITANPLLGVLSGKITAQGGTVIVACPKLPGSEEILSRQCLDQPTFEKAQRMIVHSGAGIAPLPFFSTPEEEAAFYLQAGGTAPVSDVLTGRCIFRRSGLNLLTVPGGDSAPAIALAAAGAQIIFMACGAAPPPSPVPAVCIASSAACSHIGRFDFNAGLLLKNRPMTQVSNELWNFLLAVYAGQQHVRNESYRHKSLFLF